MDDSNDWFDSAFARCRLMAILRGRTPQRTVELAQRAWDVGMDWVEVPIESNGSTEALAAAIEAGRARDRTVGAGTVTSLERVRQAAGAGAVFTVAPGLDCATPQVLADREFTCELMDDDPARSPWSAAGRLPGE